MMSRRHALMAGGVAVPLLAVPVVAVHAADWPAWIGAYDGAVRFYRSIPLEDIVPPPPNPRVDYDDRTPFGVHFSVYPAGSGSNVWLRIEGGPMQTADQGETLRFGPLVDGVALLASAEAKPAPRSATLTVRANQLSTEALFAHSDGSFWRRHFTANFTPAGADVILWVFDAAGTRARTWRGNAVKVR